MAKVWGIHMPKEMGDSPVEKGYVCIGWPLAGDIFALPADRAAFKAALLAGYPDRKAGNIQTDAGTLYRFANQLAAGDWIIFPSKHDRMVNIGKATGKRWHDAQLASIPESKPNFAEVKWLGHFARDDFSQAALNELGAFITLFQVRKHSAELLEKVGSAAIPQPSEAEEEQEVSDDVASLAASNLAKENTEDFIIRRIHAGLSGFEFEHFVAHLMECLGYTARVTDKTGDGGVDVIAHTDELGFQPPIIKIQCKRQTSQIGEPEVSQLLGTLGEGEYALFVTLGAYSRQARMRERNTPRLRLIDGEELVEMILQHYPKMSPRYRTMIPLKQIYVADLIAD